MPSSAVHFRAVCGSFLPVYIGFMFKRAKEKAALRIAIVTLRRRVDGVIFGMLLTYFFWGSLLLRCGDIESNPGPPAPLLPTLTLCAKLDSLLLEQTGRTVLKSQVTPLRLLLVNPHFATSWPP
eukprot:TRINITY_DN101275_c0_g1_i2.p1 TRINITY_DN101275_c0_g1~~TRINITY_DN101275_c0_g1_i2.p1  ORF type:complete len:124 (+),score=19.45 TRINITY_DN101275_c0_g1_i2:179-550(+)